jgi:phosphinothricin acetyltransferase
MKFAEVSVSIGQGNRVQGVGKLLMRQLIEASEKAGLWTLQSGIFPENIGSVELHLAMGFRFIGKRGV